MDPTQTALRPLPNIEETKLFLGGLPQESTIDSLTNYFSSEFGPVQEVEIMTDPVTKRSRGFGFVKFIDVSSAHKVLAKGKDHSVDGKKIEVKIAYKKGEEAAVQEIIHNRKVFVGGLTKDTTEEKLREYFGAYGTVVAVDIKREKGTDQIRGFGFVEFSAKEAVDVLLLSPIHNVGGKQMEVKKVEPKEKTRPRHKLKNVHGFDNSGMGRGRGRSGNFYQPYGGHYTTYNNTNSYGGGGAYAGGYGAGGGPGYGGFGDGYGGPPPPPPPAQYGYPPPPPQGRGAPAGYGQQPPAAVPGYGPDSYNQTRPGGAAYGAPPPPQQVGGEVGYPSTVGYNNYDQSGAAGYQQQQPQQPQQSYYDPTQQQQQQGVNQQTAGYGRGATQAQRGGYYGGQWAT